MKSILQKKIESRLNYLVNILNKKVRFKIKPKKKGVEYKVIFYLSSKEDYFTREDRRLFWSILVKITKSYGLIYDRLNDTGDHSQRCYYKLLIRERGLGDIWKFIKIFYLFI